MSVLIFIDHAEGQIKKTSLEALSYGAALAKQTGVPAEGILLGTVTEDPGFTGQSRYSENSSCSAGALNSLDAEQYIGIISGLVEKNKGYCSCAVTYQYRKSDCSGIVRKT